MTTLTVVGVEDGSIILVSESGERFFVPVNENLRDALRKSSPDKLAANRLAPKEIQAHIRKGLSAQQVSDLTGEEIGYIQKFEGAVVAEREYLIDQAMRVTVSIRGTTSAFGSAIRKHLEEISASEINWTAWREESGWVVELEFVEQEVVRNARWTFEHKKQILQPLNEAAFAISRHEPLPGPETPKLAPVISEPEQKGPERFDSDIFESAELGETGPLLEPVPYGRRRDEPGMADTADLLEVLRRKKLEEEAGSVTEDISRNSHPATGGIRLVDDTFEEAPVTPIAGALGPDDGDGDDDPEPTPPKKKRTEMPSWDDIVFGAKGDDPA